MDTLTAIHSRRTIHKYAPTRVPQTAIDQCIDAAHQAPNHKLTWPWHFVVVGESTRRTIYEMALGMRRRAPGMTPEVEEKLRAKFLDPGGMVFVTQAKCSDSFREREDYAATACAIQNFMLAAHSLGFGTKWSTGAITRLPEIYEILGVDENSETIVGLLWMGQPSQTPTITRPPVEKFTTYLP